jgi:PadR family transcriptional regulator PadR
MTEALKLSELRRGVLGACVLALLKGRPRYGLEIVRDLKAAGGLLTSGGTVYPLLNRLSESGLIEGEWTTPPGAQPRMTYSLTPGGREFLRTSEAEWTAFRVAVDGLLLSS